MKTKNRKLLKPMVMLAVLTLATLLAQVSPASTITDNFTDPSNWGAPTVMGGNMSVGSGRMNYTSASTGNAGAVIPRNTPLLPTTNDWSLKVDAHLNAFSLTAEGQFSDVFLGFGKTGDWIDTHVTFEFGRGYWGNPAHNGYSIQDDVRINGTDAPVLFHNWNVTSPDVALRMDYSAANHSVTYYFDADGATGGYNWVAQGTANLASGTYNLNLGATDTLTIFLLGSSELQTVATGQAYLSNFEITLNQSPVVTTGTATAITSSSATVNGTVNPNGLATTAQFEYGLTTNYGNTASVALSPNNGVTAQTVSTTLIGLQPDTTYHYRLTGFNSGGLGLGGDAAFVTPAETAMEAWVRTYTGPGPNYPGSAVAVDSSNSVIVLGDYSVIKYSSMGTELWTNFNAVTPVNTESSKSLQVDSSNSVIVAGTVRGGYYGDSDYAVIKYSSAGVPLWTNRYGGPLNGDDTLMSMTVDASNNVIVTGGAYVGSGRNDYCTLKYSSAGVPLWTNFYGRSVTSADWPIAVAADRSGNVIVTGITDPDGGGGQTDIATIKYSSTGVPLWTNIYNGPMNLADYPAALAVDGSNNVIVSGSSQITTGGAGYSRALTIKYSSEGVPLWSNLHQGDAYATAMAVDSGNNIIVVGSIHWGSRMQYMTLKYSSAGVLLWDDNFYGSGAGINGDWAADVAVDGHDNIIVTGFAQGYLSTYAFLTVKYSSGGATVWSMSNQSGGASAIAQAVTVDGDNNVIVTGGTMGSGVAVTVKYVTDGSVPVTFTCLTNNGTITITGCNASGGALTIPATIHGLPVTSIGDWAFQGDYLTGVSLPNAVTNIGAGAFGNCARLRSLSLPTNVNTIGPGAFGHCDSLSAVSIPNSVITIGAGAFYGCGSLASVTLGNSITNLEDSVFYGCASLTGITIPNRVTRIGTAAFSDCGSLSSLTIPDSVSRIESSAFSGCGSLASITIPDSVARIEDAVFFNCSSLTQVTFGTNLTSIGSSAFASCENLGSITIPNGVNSLGGGAFSGCTSLTQVTFGTNLTSIGTRAFASCAKLGSITIPNGVTSLGGEAFSYCTGLTNVVIPNSVTTLWDYTFSGCTGLARVTIPPSVTSIGYAAFADCTSLAGVYFQGNAPSDGSQVFSGADNVTVYYLPETTGWGLMYSGRPAEIWYLSPVFPVVTTHPQSQALQSGESATFTVIASGGFLSYQWCFNGTNLPNGGNVSGTTSARMTVTSVRTNHAGDYSVVVTNASGSVTSSVAVLTVLAVPPDITGEPGSRTNVAGSTATFTVAASGTAPLAYQWRFNGTNLAGNWNISGVTTTNLTITGVQNNDAGSYTVVVTNSFGSVTSSAATLTIIADPLAAPLAAAVDNLGLVWTRGGTVSWFAQTNTTHDGVDAAQSGLISNSQESWMQTTLTGPGTLTYWWKVSSEARYDFLTLYLDGVLQSGSISGDVGWQKRTNSIGAGTHTVRWRYEKDGWASSGQDAGWLDEVRFVPDNQAPLVDTQPVSCTNVVGTTAIFTIAASSKSPLFFQWRKNEANLVNGGNISGVTTPNLEIGGLQTTDGGNYTVVVTNAYGSVTSSVAVLTVLAPNAGLYITNATLTVEGYADFEVVTPANGIYSLLISTNLRDWASVDTLAGPTNRFFVNSSPNTMAEIGNLFVRVAVGLVPQYEFNLNLHCTAGTLVAGTPSVSFPQSVQNYSAFLEVNRIASPAAATNVFFTGPPGSGLTNALPEGSELDSENYGANYWSPRPTNPSVPPPGTWTINYGGTNLFFALPDAQARFVVPHPTVVVSNGVLVSVNWVYRDPATGQALSGSPALVNEVVVEVFGGTPVQRVYDSDDLPRGTTNHVFSSMLLWSEVESLSISYDDGLVMDGNYYTVLYAK